MGTQKTTTRRIQTVVETERVLVMTPYAGVVDGWCEQCGSRVTITIAKAGNTGTQASSANAEPKGHDLLKGS